MGQLPRQSEGLAEFKEMVVATALFCREEHEDEEDEEAEEEEED